MAVLRPALNFGPKDWGERVGGWPLSRAAGLVAAAVLLLVGTLGCDRTHEVFVVNSTDAEILWHWDGMTADPLRAGSTAREVVLAFHPRVKETKKHRFEARDLAGNILLKLELTEAELEKQNWTIVVTETRTP